MKRFNIFITLILLAVALVFAQNDPVAQGRVEWGEGSGLWVNDLFVQAYQLQNDGKALEAAAKYIEAANYESDSENTSWACWQMALTYAGGIYSTNGYNEYALSCWNPLRQYSYNQQQWDNYLSLSQSVAQTYFVLKQYEEGNKVWQELADLVNSSSSKNEPNMVNTLAACYKSIGVGCENMSKYPEAIENYKQALALNKQVNNQEEITKLEGYLERLSNKQ